MYCLPWIWWASWMSLGIMVKCLACITHKLVSSRSPVRSHLVASCNAWTACPWKCKSCTLYACAILQTRYTKGHLQMRGSVCFSNGISHREEPSLASTSRTSSAPFVKFFMGPSPYCGSDVACPSTGHWRSCLCYHLCQQLGRWQPGDLPTTYCPCSCLSLLLISSCKGVLFLFLPSEME